MAQSGPDSPLIPLDRERQRTIDLLAHHFAYDTLSVEELERRMELAYRARSVPALRDIVRDLPEDAAEAQQQRAARLPEVFTQESDRIVSVMANTKRRGAWRPARHLDVWCVMSETLLDLTQAQLPSGVTEIHLHALMASVKVIVPPNVRVVVQPSAFMADVGDNVTSPPPLGSGAPVVRISGPVIMAELKVVARRREMLEPLDEDEA